MIIINFKNYKIGKDALKLAKLIEKYIPSAIICPSSIDIEPISQKTKLKIFAQHADFQQGDKTTGYNTLKSLKKGGIKGALINHSEHPLLINNIKNINITAKKLDLKTIICTSNFGNLKSILNFKVKPYAIALEDPKLISTGRSITRHNQRAVLEFAKIMNKTKIIPLCGAGISTVEDVKQAYDLGYKGVLIASAIVNSKNPVSLLKQLRKFQR